MNSNLVEPIAERLEKGMSEQEIKNEVLALGYTEEDFDTAYSLVAAAPNEGTATPSTVKNPTSKFWIISASVLMVLLISGGAFAYYSITKNTETPNTELAQETGEDVTEQEVISSQENTPKTEYDEFGTELYGLKEGDTVIEKTIEEGDAVITYSKDGDSIERTIEVVYEDGGSMTGMVTIKLNAKSGLEETIKDMESVIASDCKDVSVDKCESAKALIEPMKECLILDSDIEINECTTNALFEYMTTQQNTTSQNTEESTISTVSEKNRESTEVVTPEAEVTSNDCSAYFDNLEQCKPFTCTYINSFSGESATKEIVGLVDGLCITREDFGIAIEECAYPEELRIELANYQKIHAEIEATGDSFEYHYTNDPETGDSIIVELVNGEEVYRGTPPTNREYEEGACTTSSI